MSPVRDIKNAAAGHGRGCTCDSCLREYNGRYHYGVDAVLAWRLAAAAVLFIAGLIVMKALPTLSVVLAILSILAAGYDVFIRTAANIVRRAEFGEHLLMSIVAVASVLIGRAAEGAFYMLLLQLGVLLQGFVMEKTRRNILEVTDIPEDRESGVFDRMLYQEEGKTRLEEFLSHFARFYTPIILLMALLFAVLGPLLLQVTVVESVYRALVLMVIACPCAIVCYVPLSFVAGIGGAARQGLVFRDSRAVSGLCRVGTVVFDKAGALEGPGLRVVSIKSDRLEADVFLRIAAHACALAEGAYADSIKAAYAGTIYIELIQSFQQDGERGVTVAVDDVSIILGTLDYAKEHGVDPGRDASDDMGVYMAIDGKYAGRILFGSVAKADTVAAVSAMGWEGGRHVVMVTEEPVSSAEKFARSAGIEQYYADCGPEKKPRILEELKDQQSGRSGLVFAGDPQRDPECFRTADVGVGFAKEDTADALTDAGLVVLEDSPAGLAAAMDTAKRTRSIALQNLIGVLVFKLIILALDMAGICPLWLAMTADVGVALAAAVNALRALITKESVRA